MNDDYKILILLSLVGALGGCAGEPPGDEEAFGRVRLNIRQVPSDVRCVRVDVGGSAQRVEAFDVTPEESATLKLHSVPAGDVEFAGDAYANTCQAIEPSSVPSWTAEPTVVHVQPGAVTEASLSMSRSGVVDVSVDFVEGPVDPCLGVVCDDRIDCTVDRCNPSTGVCEVDASACECGDCDDGNPCTIDVCEFGGCVNSVTQGAACDDGNACTEGGICDDEGTCNGSPVECDDGLLCNGQEVCDPELGCRQGTAFTCAVPSPPHVCGAPRCDEEADQCVFDGNVFTVQYDVSERAISGEMSLRCGESDVAFDDGAILVGYAGRCELENGQVQAVTIGNGTGGDGGFVGPGGCSVSFINSDYGSLFCCL